MSRRPAFHAGALGVIDEHLALLGLQRRIAVRSPHFGLIPLMVAQTQLVLTTGRLFCTRYVDRCRCASCAARSPFPALSYYQLWHEVTHAVGAGALAARAGARGGANLAGASELR